MEQATFFGIDLANLIITVGLIGVFAMIFAESGLLIGLFLPGDSLLFTAGFLASQGFIDIRVLAIGGFIAAVAGDSVGYTFGNRLGPRIFTKEDSLFFNKKNIIHSQKFYEQHGKRAIVLARFVPIVRTFAPILAGVGKMNYRDFLIFNIVGAFLWATGVSVAGYLLGSIIPNAEEYLLPIVLLIIIVSIIPSLKHVDFDHLKTHLKKRLSR